MRPAEFIALTWTVDEKPVRDWACKATIRMDLKFRKDPSRPSVILVEVTEEKYSETWGATALTYDSWRDQYIGTMPEAEDTHRYVTISFDRTNPAAPPRIHCYVSERSGRGPVPDDGSWTAGGH